MSFSVLKMIQFLLAVLDSCSKIHPTSLSIVSMLWHPGGSFHFEQPREVFLFITKSPFAVTKCAGKGMIAYRIEIASICAFTGKWLKKIKIIVSAFLFIFTKQLCIMILFFLKNYSIKFANKNSKKLFHNLCNSNYQSADL